MSIPQGSLNLHSSLALPSFRAGRIPANAVPTMSLTNTSSEGPPDRVARSICSEFARPDSLGPSPSLLIYRTCRPLRDSTACRGWCTVFEYRAPLYGRSGPLQRLLWGKTRLHPLPLPGISSAFVCEAGFATFLAQEADRIRQNLTLLCRLH